MTNKSGIEPVGCKVLIKPVQTREKTEGGLFIPDQARDGGGLTYLTGVIYATGSLAFLEPAWDRIPQVSETVIYSNYNGGDITGLDGESYILADDKDISAVLASDG